MRHPNHLAIGLCQHRGRFTSHVPRHQAWAELVSSPPKESYLRPVTLTLPYQKPDKYASTFMALQMTPVHKEGPQLETQFLHLRLHRLQTETDFYVQDKLAGILIKFSRGTYNKTEQQKNNNKRKCLSLPRDRNRHIIHFVQMEP